MQRSELQDSLRLIGDLVLRGGLVTTIDDGAASGTPVARLVMQPDADTVVKVAAARVSDPGLSAQVSATMQALAATLDTATQRLQGMHRIAMLVITLVIGNATVFGVWNMRGLAWQVGTVTALALIALLLRWLAGVAMRMLLARAMRKVA